MRWATLFVVALVVAAILSNSLVRIGEGEQVLLTRFGRPVGAPITTPGLHFKLPFVHTVHVFDRNALDWRGEQQVASRDRVLFDVEMTASWHIDDVRRFYETVRDAERARALLDDVLRSAARAAVAERGAEELLSAAGGRDEAAREILERSKGRLRDLGIELLDMRLLSLVRQS